MVIEKNTMKSKLLKNHQCLVGNQKLFMLYHLCIIKYIGKKKVTVQVRLKTGIYS